MQLIPAIDILEGKVVRLSQGDYRQVTEWGHDPVELALRYQDQGARRLHLVDLAGAREPAGRVRVLDLVSSLAERTSLEIQIGGGARGLGDVRDLLSRGARRVVVGTMLFSDPRTLRKAVLLFGADRLVAAVDSRDGRVQVKGWTENTGVPVARAVEIAERSGVGEILMTSIERDGMGSGPDLALYRQILPGLTRCRLIASGGVRHSGDLENLQRLGCSAAVVGRALLGGQVSPESWRPKPMPTPARCEPLSSDLAVRIIPCLDVDQGRVVKGTSFQNLRDAGDPIELAGRYCEDGADELAFLDITATSHGRRTATALAKRVSRRVNIPFTIGGGVRTGEDALRLLEAGADKVVVNSAAVRRPELLSEMAETLGSANTVCAIDARRTGAGWTVLVSGGREDTGRDALAWAREVGRRGAGEILLTSFDRDGTGSGFDTELLRQVKLRVSIPVIASGGAGALDTFVEAAGCGADGLLAASVFHFGEYSIFEVKKALRQAAIRVRP